MEQDLKKIMLPKTIKNKNNNNFENRIPPHFFLKEDDLIFFLIGRQPQRNNAT